jgi:hypothetical protein
MHRMPVGLPSSTPAFQAGLMYGGPVDIPAFEFLDKRTGEYLWFPRPWVSARIEAAHAEGRRGIMEKGRTYGCVFGGGADDTVFTFAHLLRPSPAWSTVGLRAALIPWLILTWASLTMAARTCAIALRWLARFLGTRLRRRPRPSSRRLLYRLLISEWLRGLFTLSVTADIYAGVSAIYVNYVDYDIPAHALGPLHSSALRTLRLVDKSIKNIARVISRVPEWRYDLYVLSDHGMTRSVPFEALSGGVSAVDAVLIAFQCAKSADSHADGKPPTRRELRWPLASASQRHLAYLEPRSRERDAVWCGPLCVVPAGPNMNIYLLDHEQHVLVEQIEHEYPGAVETLSRHPGIGFLLARDRAGPVCFFRGILLRIPPPPGPTGCPLFDRPDRSLVVQELQNLLAMRRSGDIVVYGNYSGSGPVSFLGERGSHAGPSEDELYGFMLASPQISFDFDSVTGPRDLYPLFIQYQEQTGR